MKNSLAHLYVRIAMLAVFALVAGKSFSQPISSGGTLDPLVRKSLPAADGGSKSLLLAVTRAGDRLVAVGERGLVTLSDDHGVSWKQSPTPVSVLLTGVKFANPKVGWAVGHSGIVLRSIDGGVTWTKQLDGAMAANLVMDSLKSKVASGDSRGMFKRQLIEAERLVQDGADKPFLDLHIESEKTAIVIGAYGLIFRTDDGGETWKSWQDKLPNFNGAHLNAIKSIGKSIIIVGEQGVMYSSNDGGYRFRELKSPYKGSYFGVLQASEKTLTAFGLRGTVVWSKDAGATWRNGHSSIQASLDGGSVLKNGDMVFVSQGGNVLLSTNGGQTLAPLQVEIPSPFVGITQAADGGLILVGARGVSRLSLPR